VIRFVAALGLAIGMAIFAPATIGFAQQEATTDASEAADDLLVGWMTESWTGDLDGIVERGFLRVGTAYNPVLFSYSRADQRGIVVDITNEMLKHLQKTLGKPAKNLTVVIAALPRDQLIPALNAGKVDMLMANLTVTPERSGLVDFADPVARGVREVLVTGPSAPPIETLDDLANITLRLRPSSSYFEHMKALNASRAAAGKPEIPVEPMDERLEDSDILDLISAGTLPAAIVDAHMAKLYAQIIEGLTVREDIAINEGGDIAWAVRKSSPKLRDALNGFVKKAAKGTLLGNMLYSRYFEDTKRVANAMSPESSERFRQTIGLIQKYADQYSFDTILIAAQAYQESRLDQAKRSPVGAIGIMQVMPATARDPAIGIPNIDVADNNVRAGVKYLRLMRDQYFNDPAISDFDQTLFSFAAYNAGPGNISKARKRAVKMGLDPNVWLGQVELAAARVVSREPVIYVRNIMKYYVTYQLFAETRALKKK